jgi:hypothetical protein
MFKPNWLSSHIHGVYVYNKERERKKELTSTEVACRWKKSDIKSLILHSATGWSNIVSKSNIETRGEIALKLKTKFTN